jgi:histidine triad (HIT) family protein
MFDLLKRAAKQQGIEESGFRTVINTHPDSRQSVYQLHIHVLGGRKMDWTDGFTDAGSASPPSR